MPNQASAKERPDGGMETSVNWEDAPEALMVTFRDRGNSEHGVARLRRHHIERVSEDATTPRLVTCERSELPSNPYHGNLVFKAGIPKQVQRMVAAALALNSAYVPRPEH
jgi:hypothetical protein